MLTAFFELIGLGLVLVTALCSAILVISVIESSFDDGRSG